MGLATVYCMLSTRPFAPALPIALSNPCPATLTEMALEIAIKRLRASWVSGSKSLLQDAASAERVISRLARIAK